MFAWLALVAGPLVALLNDPLVLSLLDLLAVAEAPLLIFQPTVVLDLPLDLKPPR